MILHTTLFVEPFVCEKAEFLVYIYIYIYIYICVCVCAPNILICLHSVLFIVGLRFLKNHKIEKLKIIM